MGGWKVSQPLQYDNSAWGWRTNGRPDQIGDFWRDATRQEVTLVNKNSTFSKTRGAAVHENLKERLVALFECLHSKTPSIRGGKREQEEGDLSQDDEHRNAYIWHTLKRQVWELGRMDDPVELSEATVSDALKELLEEMASGRQPGTAARDRFLKSSIEKNISNNHADAGGRTKTTKHGKEAEEQREDAHEKGQNKTTKKDHDLNTGTMSKGKEKQKEVQRLKKREAREALRLAVDEFNKTSWRNVVLDATLSQALAKLHAMVEKRGFSLVKAPRPDVKIEPATFNAPPIDVQQNLVDTFLLNPGGDALPRWEKYRKPNPLKRKVEEPEPSNKEEPQRKKAKPDEGDVAIEHWDDKMIAEAEAICTDPLIDAVLHGMENVGEAIEAAADEGAKNLLRDMDSLVPFFTLPESAP
ncbi:hypothetical protein FRB90_006476 [Tulasnella sp. 427]|nr:hypothetical protein FRB90_006476 [Tulasnella sp. 427]